LLAEWRRWQKWLKSGSGAAICNGRAAELQSCKAPPTASPVARSVQCGARGAGRRLAAALRGTTVCSSSLLQPVFGGRPAAATGRTLQAAFAPVSIWPPLKPLGPLWRLLHSTDTAHCLSRPLPIGPQEPTSKSRPVSGSVIVADQKAPHSAAATLTTSIIMPIHQTFLFDIISYNIIRPLN